jgi:hypothetical protein
MIDEDVLQERGVLFDGTRVGRLGGQWFWRNHDRSWEPVTPDSVIAIALAAALNSGEVA